MWSAAHTETVDAGSEAVWRLWGDPAAWPTWDSTLERAALDGPLAAGATLMIKPAASGPVRFEVVDAEFGRGFTSRTRLPFAVMSVEHRLYEPCPGRTALTYRVTIVGPLWRVWARVFQRGLERNVPATVRSLAGAAESLSRGAGTAPAGGWCRDAYSVAEEEVRPGSFSCPVTATTSAGRARRCGGCESTARQARAPRPRRPCPAGCCRRRGGR